MKARGIQLESTDGTPLSDEEKATVLDPSGDKIAYFPREVSCGMTIEIFERGPRETSLIHQRDELSS